MPSPKAGQSLHQVIKALKERGIAAQLVLPEANNGSVSNKGQNQDSFDTQAVLVSDISEDSRQLQENWAFSVVRGAAFDGAQFVEEAEKKGACLLVVSELVTSVLPQLLVENVREASAHIACVVHGDPSRKLKVIGITGTNGKTTTVSLLSDILNFSSISCSTIGTLGGARTTPNSADLQRLLASRVARGDQVVAMEVSSHALDQHRVAGVEFFVTAFTNLSVDHLGYHHDMESYFLAKAALFSYEAPHRFINVDDSWGQKLFEQTEGAESLSINDTKRVVVLDREVAGSLIRWRSETMRVPLPGDMNIANALFAAEIARCFELDDAEIANAVNHCSQVPGRMQRVLSPLGTPNVVVDYSHTPDSLQRALRTLKNVHPVGRLIVVFGCGGDRDRSKRPLMGKIASELADYVVVTSDNPRSEDPNAIISEIVAGFSTEASNYSVIEDRREAIESAIISAEQIDVVLIAGKGHERTQTIGERVIEFSDVDQAQQVLKLYAAKAGRDQ